MRYDPASLLPGDIILVEGNSPLSTLIRWATGSPLSHAAMYIGAGSLVEALWKVSLSKSDKYIETGWAYRVDATEAQRERLVVLAVKKLGAPYGLRELLEDGVRDFMHIPVGARWQPKRYTCSGLVAHLWEQAGVKLTYAPLPSPADLANSPLLNGPRPWLSAKSEGGVA